MVKLTALFEGQKTTAYQLHNNSVSRYYKGLVKGSVKQIRKQI